MTKFRNLLLKAGHKQLVERVVHAAWRYFWGRILTLQTEAQAEEVYNDAQKYIKTITRLELAASNHIDVNVQLFADVASRSFFYRAFRDTGPQIEVLVLKIPTSPSAHPDFTDAAEHELTMYKKLEGPSAGPPHLVPLEQVVFRRGASVTREDSTVPVSKGLLLPRYAATLADFSFLSENRLLHLGRQMKEALAHMHAHSLCHCDIKPSNIFYSRSGDWYLGDYGATIEVGKGLIESTPNYCKGFGMRVDRGSYSLDKWLLAVSLLEKLPKGKLASSRHEARQMVERITSQPLQDLISGLLEASAAG